GYILSLGACAWAFYTHHESIGDPTPPRPLIVGAGEVLWDLFPDGDHFGGAPANVVVHAAALGADAALVSAVGRDARGDAALERLAAGRVDCTAVSRLAGHPTGVVHVRIDAAGLPSYDIAVGSAWDFIPWTALVERAAQRADAICFGALAEAAAGSRGGLRLAALTRGACGSLLVSAQGAWEAPAPRTEIVDTVGAGDAFTAALLLGILAGRSLDEVNERANAVAAYVCSQPGATPPIPFFQ